MAETTAWRLRVSGSQLFSTAIAEFLGCQQSNAITERLDKVYSRERAAVDPALHRAQLTSLGKDSWQEIEEIQQLGRLTCEGFDNLYLLLR
jgi:hypothetical protein